MDTRTKALEIENLSYSYRSDFLVKKFLALQEFSLDVFGGESFGFLGGNGAGKTTTIKCILGLIKPKSGSIKIFGKSNRDSCSRTLVGYLPEQPYFYDYLTVTEMMEMYAALSGVARVDRMTKIQRALDLVKVSHKSKSPMRSLSKGLTQRVAMAQAIVAEPKLLILDEPFSGLDPIGRKEFRDLLFMLKKEGTTIFMSSHILSDVEFLCERVSILAKGVLKGVFVVQEISAFTKGHYELVLKDSSSIAESLKSIGDELIIQERFTRVRFTERPKADDALKAAMDAGVHIESFEFKHGGLEDLFVSLVKGETKQ